MHGLPQEEAALNRVWILWHCLGTSHSSSSGDRRCRVGFAAWVHGCTRNARQAGRCPLVGALAPSRAFRR